MYTHIHTHASTLTHKHKHTHKHNDRTHKHTPLLSHTHILTFQCPPCCVHSTAHPSCPLNLAITVCSELQPSIPMQGRSTTPECAAPCHDFCETFTVRSHTFFTSFDVRSFSPWTHKVLIGYWFIWILQIWSFDNKKCNSHPQITKQSIVALGFNLTAFVLQGRLRSHYSTSVWYECMTYVKFG